VRAGNVTPKELCAQAAEAVARIDLQIEAVLGLYEDVVADPGKDGPSKQGRLYGVPMFLKDLGSGPAGRRQESGSKLFKDHVVEATDPLVENYLSAGLIPIGRSTTPEFGMTFDTATDYLGRVKVTRNPWRLERTPGGSSGGSAAAVAAGMVGLADGSDMGGSIRIPASCCGLVGLKPSRGRVSIGPDLGDVGAGVPVDSVLTRTVLDTATALDAIAGYEPGDHHHAREPATPFVEAARRPPGPVPIRVALSAPLGVPIDGEPRAATRRAAQALADLGHDVQDGTPDWDDEAFPSSWETFATGALQQPRGVNHRPQIVGAAERADKRADHAASIDAEGLELIARPGDDRCIEHPSRIGMREHRIREPARPRRLTQAVLDHIRTGGYTYTLAPGPYGEDGLTSAIDEFWLDRKLGFCEHFAAAFVVVMSSTFSRGNGAAMA